MTREALDVVPKCVAFEKYEITVKCGVFGKSDPYFLI